MTTPITSLYEAISELLLRVDIATNQKTTDICHVDLFETQPDREGKEIAYTLPAVFADFELTGSETGFTHKEDYTLKIHLESAQFGSTAQNSHNKENSLKSLERAEKLKFMLIKSLKMPAGFSPLQFVSLTLPKKGKNNPVHILTYKTSFHTRINC